MWTVYWWTETIRRMRTLVVTGGIGSGKSYVVQMFAALGIAVYDADTRTKRLYDMDSQLLESLVDLLGDGLVRDGRLDRQYMAARIFSDKELLTEVESLVYPKVREDFEAWRTRADGPFVIMESAVYLEKPLLAGMADKVLTVTCPEETRVERVMLRSPMSRQQVVERIHNQWPDSRRTALSDYVVVSDFRHPLLPQVYEVYVKMKEDI
ncbi:MAG TPA: dephospho-CoA kinase [Candidatus Coprenecus pullistercoris]|nr:dephospho-CoA kinase [Candidatus Coprenecus pullistercoris]